MESSGEKKYYPLTVSNHLVGKIHVDFKTGQLEGVILDSDLLALIDNVFGSGLMEFGFFGKPAIPSEEARRKFLEYMDKVNE